MAVLFQCLLCVKLYECHIKYAGRFLDIKEISKHTWLPWYWLGNHRDMSISHLSSVVFSSYYSSRKPRFMSHRFCNTIWWKRVTFKNYTRYNCSNMNSIRVESKDLLSMVAMATCSQPSNKIPSFSLWFQGTSTPNIKSIQPVEIQELLRYHCGCHDNLVTTATNNQVSSCFKIGLFWCAGV